MQNLPHHYEVAAAAAAEGNVDLTSSGLTRIDSAPPAEFDGDDTLRALGQPR